jgi:hypothetical protein
VNLVDSYGLKGGALIPIRNAIKKNATANDILGPKIDNTVAIPYMPFAAAAAIMAPTPAGDSYLDYYMTRPPFPYIPMGNIYMPEILRSIREKEEIEIKSCP